MLASPIVTVASPKGGIGKTTLAYELAAALGAVLVDLDWDGGGATGRWGDSPERRLRSAVLTGLASGAGPTPRFLRASGRPDLVPADTRLAELTGVEPGRVIDRLTAWAVEWERPVVVDTHPGTGALSDGAIAAAQCVVVPVVLGGMELAALDGFLRVRSDFPLLLAPNRFAGRARERRLLRQLWNLSRAHEVEVAPPISDHPWLPHRARRSAVVLTSAPGGRVAKAAGEFRGVADVVRRKVGLAPAALPLMTLEVAHA
ncbi:MAG: ParA family protein [Candidatus Dormibacteria bacterium]